jgi:hypothetical protein
MCGYLQRNPVARVSTSTRSRISGYERLADRRVLVHVVGILGEGAVDVAARQHHEALDTVVDTMVEQLLGAAHVDVVAGLLVGAEVPDETHVDDVGRQLRADHVFELLAGEVDDVDVDPLGVSLPVHPVDAADFVMLHQAPGEQPALTA